MSYPHFQVTANVAIDPLIKYIKRQGFHFTSALVYWLTMAAHEIDTLKWRIRGEGIVEHDTLDPSFAVLTEVSDVFSFCTVEFDRKWQLFQLRSKSEIERMRNNPSFEDEEGKDNFLFMSSLPWVNFTAIQHPISMPADSVPRITWGRATMTKEGMTIPISIQAHHALVDGKDLGRFFLVSEAFASDPKLLFES